MKGESENEFIEIEGYRHGPLTFQKVTKIIFDDDIPVIRYVESHFYQTDQMPIEWNNKPISKMFDLNLEGGKKN